MTTFSTCITCGTWLTVVDHGQTAHPGCETSLDELTARFLDACEGEDQQRIDRLAQALENHDRRPVNLRAAALAYAAWGWPVFPLKPGGKTPATAHGFKDASTDRATIEAWWRNQPDANIGLPTGHAFDVIDVDMDTPGGIWSWVDLRDSGGLGDIHGLAVTPHGQHVLVAATGGGNMAGFRPGLDYRGRGGYIVAPPSRRPEGSYGWSVRPSPALTGQPAGQAPSAVSRAA